ncbi:TetR/AcrR family transcriptional regulator [Streptomyces brevispora]|uniref:TetR/AcrR family transcriptional regulator n=1 Tax=Streptomyces brevispora TaxID=887462 RepID=UPI002E330C75|nr:TetR/AcrR family transcriptional regulator [Streptomyces brevispora]
MPDRRTAILRAAARTVSHRGVRGLRVEEVAAEAHVSKALIYHHYGDRAGLLRHTLDFINDRAGRYTGQHSGPDRPAGARQALERSLLLEFQDVAEVRENSIAWGELRASAVFDPRLRDDLARAGRLWVREVADILGRVRPGWPDPALVASAERLTALVEGLSTRWLSGMLPTERARGMLREGVAVEVEHLDRPPRREPLGAMPRRPVAAYTFD